MDAPRAARNECSRADLDWIGCFPVAPLLPLHEVQKRRPPQETGEVTQVEVTDVESLMASLTGLQIVGGGHDGPDGLHFELSDGRYLIITGMFVVGLCRVGETQVH